jgi:hypothetical protein
VPPVRGLRKHLSEALFPDSPAGSSTLSRWEGAILVTALLALGVVLQLARLGFPGALNTIWAEDGPIYLQGALTQGFFDAVFSPYAGYLVVGPRLIGETANLVPLDYAPAALAIVSALVACLSGLAVWFAASGHVRNPYLRGALALATAFCAVAGQETLDSAAYAPWYTLVATFWILFWRPRTMTGAVLGGLLVLLTGLSTPGVWFFLPIAFLRALAIRDRRDATIVGFYGVGAAVQIPVVLGQEQGDPLWVSEIWTGFMQRIVDAGIFGERLGGALWSELGWPFLTVLGIAVLIGLAIGLRRALPSASWFAALAIPTGVLIFFISVYQRTVGPNIFWSPGTSGGTASRYVMVPALLLLSAGVVLIDGMLRRRRGEEARGLSWPVVATVGVMLLAIVTSFDMSGEIRDSPKWDDSLREAGRVCLAEDGEAAGIPTSPEPFGVYLPCDQVTPYAK